MSDFHVCQQGAEQVTHFCRLLHSPMPDPLQSDGEPPQSKPLTDSQRIRKVVVELIETERAYVKVSVKVT